MVLPLSSSSYLLLKVSNAAQMHANALLKQLQGMASFCRIEGLDSRTAPSSGLSLSSSDML